MNRSVLSLTVLGFLLAWRMLSMAPPSHEATGVRTAAQDLFEGLAQSKLLVVTPEARLSLPPADAALAAEWRGAPFAKAAAQRVIDLYNTEIGHSVREQISLWNHSRQLVAIRDDGAANGLTHGVWRAYGCNDDQILSTRALVDESFGYVHQGRLREGFSPWMAVASQSECVEWRGEFEASRPLALNILYIGRFLEGVPKEQTFAYEPPPAQRERTTSSCAGPAQVSQVGEWRLPESVWHRTPQGIWQLSARLRLLPAITPNLSTQGVRVGVSESCELVWHAPRPGSGRTLASWSITTADGTSLLDPELHPTTEAERLGLVPLVGFGREDYHGLGVLLGSASPGGRLTLTLDSRLQMQANVALEAGLNAVSKNEGARRPGRQDPWALERRAALVLLGPDGAILATSSHPQPPSLTRVTTWDLAAFGRVYPLANPLQMRTWEGVDRHQAAGSTFKPLVALAGLQGGEDLPQVHGMLAGLAPEDFEQLTGLNLRATEIDPYAGVVGGNEVPPEPQGMDCGLAGAAPAINAGRQ